MVNLLTLAIEKDDWMDFISSKPVEFKIIINSMVEAQIGEYSESISDGLTNLLLEIQYRYKDLSENPSKIYLASLNTKLTEFVGGVK